MIGLGALSTAWAQLPPGAQIGPGGVRAELSVPDAKGGIWRLQVYRPKRSSSSPRHVPGEIDLCLAVDKGGKRWHGIVCELTASMALQLDRRGVKADCGGGGNVLGEPVPPSATCGLVPADVQSVTVTAEGWPAQSAALSEPFQIRVNRSDRVLERAGLDPERVRALPPVLKLRAYLAFVNTPPTELGERTPRITVTATRADGGTASRSFGGHLIPPVVVDPPPLPPRPPPGARLVRLSATGPGGRVWRSSSWADDGGGLCTRLQFGKRRRTTAMGCYGRRNLAGQLAESGSATFTGSGLGPRAGYAVFGFAHGDAAAVDVIGPHGRAWRAQLSPAWASVRRGRQVLRARSFLAVLSGRQPRFDEGIEVRTTLADGRVLTRER